MKIYFQQAAVNETKWNKASIVQIIQKSWQNKTLFSLWNEHFRFQAKIEAKFRFEVKIMYTQ